MSQEQIDILQRALSREKAARRAAEKILEDKSRELYFTTEELKEANLQLEDLLDQKSSQLEGFFEKILDAYVVIDIHGNVIKFNQPAIELFGYDIRKESLNVVNLIYEEDLTYAMTSFEELNKTGSFKDYEARIYTKNKEVKWVHINASVIYDHDKQPIAAQGIVRDITLERAADEKLVESENRLSSLILNLDSGILLEDENRKIVLTNNKFCELFQIPVSPDLLTGQDCTNSAKECKHLFKQPNDFTKNISEILKNKEKVLGDELIMVDGSILERNFIPILKGDQYKGHLWTYRNVTLNRQYRKSLEAQKQKYSNIIANMNLGLVEINNNDEILMVNQSFCNMSGFAEAELIGKKGRDIFPINKDSDITHKDTLNPIPGKSNTYELKVINKKGQERQWLMSGAPNFDLKGEVIGFIAIHLDITEFKALENQKENILRELEKSNEELNEYAHVVSHDLKSPLRSLDALVSWIKTDNENKFDEITLQNFGLIQSTLETMEELITNILEYSSAGVSIINNQNIDLNETLKSIERILLIPEHISFKVKHKLPTITGDGTKFQQLFQNLISNAVKFCNKEKGLVEVGYLENASYHKFYVKDNGIGIEKKHHDRIFKIFQSLNKRADSSGIGLSIAKKIVDLYEGNIWLESKPGKGSTFYFTIKKR